VSRKLKRKRGIKREGMKHNRERRERKKEKKSYIYKLLVLSSV